MKFGCCSDTHGKQLPAFNDVDFVLHAGDLYDFDKMTAETAISIVEFHRKHKTIFVRGNHDASDELCLMRPDISGKIGKLTERLWLVGIGMGIKDTMLPSEGHLLPQCKAILKTAMETMQDGDQCIILTHYPALTEGSQLVNRYKSNTAGFFFNCVRMVCEALNPLIVIQGHTHSMNGKTVKDNGLTYVWPGPTGMVIDIDAKMDVTITKNSKKLAAPTLWDKETK